MVIGSGGRKRPSRPKEAEPYRHPTAEAVLLADYLLWYARDAKRLKYNQLFLRKELGVGEGSGQRYDQKAEDGRFFQLTSLTSV
jgi:hypothetical protein